MEDIGNENRIKSIIDEDRLRKTEELSRNVEDIVKQMVKSKCEVLDDIIHSLRGMLRDETDILTDQEIEDILLQLPSVLYDAMGEQEIIGVQSDLANQIYKEAQSEAYRLARGTISDKNAVADIQTRSQQLDKIIYERAYKIMKGKLEMAVETLNAVKKVQATRQQRYAGTQQELRGINRM